MAELEPVIAMAVISDNKIQVKAREDLTASAAVVLTSVLVRRMAQQFDLTPEEFIQMVEDSLEAVENERPKPRLIVQ
jgi:hypothetical protein